MKKAALVLLAMVLCLVLLIGTASATSISVGQQGQEVFIEVKDDGNPVNNASVTVSGVDEETPLDGEYVTDEDGLIIFDGEGMKELKGVVHLRITVRKDGSIKSALSSITRGSEVGSAPLGQRMSKGLHGSAESTRGKIEARMNVINKGERGIEKLGEDIDQTIVNLGNAQFEREVISRDLAAGDINATVFYLRTVRNTGDIAFLRSSLDESVSYLNRYSDPRLSENGIDPVELERLRIELEDDRVIGTDRRVTE